MVQRTLTLTLTLTLTVSDPNPKPSPSPSPNPNPNPNPHQLSHRWLDPEAAEAAELAAEEDRLRAKETYWEKVRRGGSTRAPTQQQPAPRPRSAIQPATIKMLAAAGLPPHAVKASVGAKKLDYLYAAYTLVTERYAEAELRSSSQGGAQAELRGVSASSSVKSSKSTARGRGA